MMVQVAVEVVALLGLSDEPVQLSIGPVTDQPTEPVGAPTEPVTVAVKIKVLPVAKPDELSFTAVVEVSSHRPRRCRRGQDETDREGDRETRQGDCRPRGPAGPRRPTGSNARHLVPRDGSSPGATPPRSSVE